MVQQSLYFSSREAVEKLQQLQGKHKRPKTLFQFAVFDQETSSRETYLQDKAFETTIASKHCHVISCFSCVRIAFVSSSWNLRWHS
jgi:hypothetical protein